MSEEDVAQKAEKLERSRKIGGGTAEDTTSARLTLTARGDTAKAAPPYLAEHRGLMRLMLMKRNDEALEYLERFLQTAPANQYGSDLPKVRQYVAELRVQ